MFDWNDLRHFLAVARTGSTMAAAKSLRVSQATVSRRIGVLEDALGTALFIHAPTGYSLTPRGEAVLPAAEAVEAAVGTLTALVEAETRRLTGTVRITSVEGVANQWIMPALGQFRLVHPEVRAEVLVDDRNLDLIHGEADIAIRFGDRPSEASLICRHLFDIEETVYVHRDIVVSLGLPSSLADLARYPLVGLSGGFGHPITDWYRSIVPDVDFAHSSNSASGVMAGVRAGLGAAVMPCIIGDATPQLVRLFPPIPELSASGWLVTTDSARKQPHVRAMIDFLVSYIETMRARGMVLDGEAQAA